MHNRIVFENRLPGSPSTEWDVNGAGTQDIQGFATRASLLPGETVSFKVRLANPEPFRIDIFRLGYYGGLGARKVGSAALVSSSGTSAALVSSYAQILASRQPDCHREDEGVEVPTQLVDCGNWAVVASFAIPLDATTGLYFGRATLLNPNDNWRTDDSPKRFDPNHAMVGRDPLLPPDGSLPHAYGAAGRNRPRNALTLPRASHIWFVVRELPAAVGSHAWAAGRPDRDLLFQTADLTWQAYNGYGGYTTYGSFDYPREHAPARRLLNLSEPGHQQRRAYKRSLNTPLITRDYRACNMPLHAEYPAIRFLERNGFDMHYCAGADLATSRAAPL